MLESLEGRGWCRQRPAGTEISRSLLMAWLRALKVERAAPVSAPGLRARYRGAGAGT
nr:hypothetical protein [Lichenibacterium minor]